MILRITTTPSFVHLRDSTSRGSQVTNLHSPLTHNLKASVRGDHRLADMLFPMNTFTRSSFGAILRAAALVAMLLIAAFSHAEDAKPAEDAAPVIEVKPVITHSFLATGSQTYIIEYKAATVKEKEPDDDVLFEDFEKEKYEGWTSEGAAFGDGPIEIAKMPAYQGNVNGQGKRIVNAHNTRNGENVTQGDAHTGTLTSKEFTITHRHIRLLIGGGAHKDKTCVNILIDGRPVASATGRNSNAMHTHHFDLTDFKGKTARIQIVDQVAGGWGNIGVDHIVFTNRIASQPARPDGGRIVWRSPRNSRDGWVLPNGNVLLAVGKSNDLPGGGVVEAVRQGKDAGKEIIRYKGTQSEVDTVQPLDHGGFILTEAGNNPRLLELDKDGKIVVEVKLKTQLQNHHMQQRMSRKLPNGNYLVPHLLDKAVREYNAKGEIVWEAATPNWAFTAIRLENGNTLVGCTYGKTVVELDKAGKITWQIEPKDLKGVSELIDACGVQRLPNGNTVICDYGAPRSFGGKGGPRLIEVTRDKQVVWTFDDRTLPTIHHVQILDTNDKPLEGIPMR